MVTPKPHWNLFLRWLRKVQRTSESGSGSSFFSNVAPTIQLLSSEPEGGAGAGGSRLDKEKPPGVKTAGGTTGDQVCSATTK